VGEIALDLRDVAKILPNHGDPDIIKKGGYDKTLIDASVGYVTKMLTRSNI
jgi:hypothetical protein